MFAYGAASLRDRLDRKLYPGVQKNWDDALFRERLLGKLRATDVVLDVGAGAGIISAMNFRGKVARVCGVDLDPRVLSNPFLDEAHQSAAENLPYDDETFDIVFADNVLEHLERPVCVLKEVLRVMKPGGYFMAKTPNKKHYMPAIARCTPHSFHAYVNRLRGRSEVDTFPTRYRINTVAEIARLAGEAGLELESVELVEGRPEYLRITPLTYLAGWLYERSVNRFEFLRRFRILLIVTLRKPE